MKTKWIVFGLGFCTLAYGLIGCVKPGSVDVDEIHRLQQAILARSPQDRSQQGLGLMRPVEETVPDLNLESVAGSKTPQVKMTLQDAVMRALANSPDIAVVAYTPAITRERVIQAASEFDYTLFGSVGYTSTDRARSRRAGISGVVKEKQAEVGIRQRTITGAEWQLSNTFVRSWDNSLSDRVGRWYDSDLALSVTQPLLQGAWPEVNLANLRIARLDHKVSRSQFRQAVEETMVQVITAYYRLIQSRQSVVIANRLLKRTQETYDLVKGRSELDATKVPIQQAKAAIQDAKTDVINAKKAVSDVQDALLRLLGDKQLNLLTKVEVLPVSKMGEEKVKIDEADQLLTALRLNPALEQARLAIQQADINVKVSKWNTLPQLNLVAGVGLNGASRQSRSVVWDDMVSGDYLSYNVGLTFEYPLGNRFRKSQLRESRFARFQAISNMQATADTIAQVIRERIRQIYSRHDELQAQKKALVAYKEQLDGLEKLETIRGKRTPEFMNLKLNAQRSVAQAEQRVNQATVDYNVAMLDLAQATGSVLELQQVKLALPVAMKMPTFRNAMPPSHQPAKDKKNRGTVDKK